MPKKISARFSVCLLLSISLLGCQKTDLRSNDNLILSISIPNIDAKVSIGHDTISINVEKGVNITSLTPVIYVSPYATLFPNSGVAQNFSTPVVYTVTSQSEKIKRYYVKVVPAFLSSQNNILSCTLVNMSHSATINGDKITLRVPKLTDLTALTPIFELSQFASISPKSGEQQDFTVPVEYTVTAENGLIQKYIVSAESTELSIEKEVLDFQIPNAKYQSVLHGKDRHFSFYGHTDLQKIAPIITISEYATISPSSGQYVDFSQPVLYTVTSENGSDFTFTVTADNKLSSKADLLHFSIKDVVSKVERNGNTIDIYVPNDVDITKLRAFTQLSPYATAVPSDDAVVDFSSPVKYTVTSSDGTIQDYTVTATRSPWRCLIANGAAPFLKVDGHRLVAYDGYMWLLGGWLGSHHNFADPNGDYWTSQVWRTKDGLTWENLGNAPWKGRHGFGCVSFKGKMWVISGDANRDIWSSRDGKRWVKEADSVPFNWRYFPYVTVFKDKIWLIGGANGWWNNYEVYSDVWSSEDGVAWKQEIRTAAFAARSTISGSVVLNDNIYIIGGGASGSVEFASSYNDVWKSSNGIDYRSATIEAPFRPIYWHSIGVYGSQMYLVAGMQRGNIHSNEVWYSKDGSNWKQQKHSFWLSRHATSVVEFNGKLYMVGGTADPTPSANRNTMNDVWVMDGEFE